MDSGAFLTILALLPRSGDMVPAARTNLVPFLTLAAIIAAGAVADRLASLLCSPGGLFRSGPHVGSYLPLCSQKRSGPAWTLVDLIPMFAIATAIRALLVTGVTLGGGFISQVVTGSALAATANNLPAAAAVRPVGSVGEWAAILAMASVRIFY
jgi:hypothetical protein